MSEQGKLIRYDHHEIYVWVPQLQGWVREEDRRVGPFAEADASA